MNNIWPNFHSLTLLQQKSEKGEGVEKKGG